MAIAKKSKTIIQRIDGMSSVLKLGIVLVSGYLVFRKYKQEVGLQLPPELIGPVASPGITVVPTSEPQQIAYQPASPDMITTAQQMLISQVPEPLQQTTTGIVASVRDFLPV